jgi:hypothetical protein
VDGRPVGSPNFVVREQDVKDSVGIPTGFKEGVVEISERPPEMLSWQWRSEPRVQVLQAFIVGLQVGCQTEAIDIVFVGTNFTYYF